MSNRLFAAHWKSSHCDGHPWRRLESGKITIRPHYWPLLLMLGVTYTAKVSTVNSNSNGFSMEQKQWTLCVSPQVVRINTNANFEKAHSSAWCKKNRRWFNHCKTLCCQADLYRTGSSHSRALREISHSHTHALACPKIDWQNKSVPLAALGFQKTLLKMPYWLERVRCGGGAAGSRAARG